MLFYVYPVMIICTNASVPFGFLVNSKSNNFIISSLIKIVCQYSKFLLLTFLILTHYFNYVNSFICCLSFIYYYCQSNYVLSHHYFFSLIVGTSKSTISYTHCVIVFGNIKFKEYSLRKCTTF